LAMLISAFNAAVIRTTRYTFTGDEKGHVRELWFLSLRKRIMAPRKR
jgi:hypothetical protein